MSRDYYNEIDPKAAAWLRELIRAGLLPEGDVDERSIEDVAPNDLRGYRHCHFFAGIGGWAYALDLAGWPDSVPVWTGSCPCQPFSAAGKGAGFEDERHLWPAFQHLIAQCEPSAVLGEQVASKAADEWIDLVQADLEGMGYAFGCIPFPAAGIGAPHIRDRNYWLAYRHDSGLEGWKGAAGSADQCAAGKDGMAGRVADADSRECAGLAELRRTERDGQDAGRQEGCGSASASGEFGGVGNTISSRRQPQQTNLRFDGRRVEQAGWEQVSGIETGSYVSDEKPAASPLDGFWRAADWLFCRDGKWRPVEPGTFPLADGIPARVVRLRGYGNAIVPKQAAIFIQAAAEVLGIQCGDLLALEAVA